MATKFIKDTGNHVSKEVVGIVRNLVKLSKYAGIAQAQLKANQKADALIYQYLSRGFSKIQTKNDAIGLTMKERYQNAGKATNSEDVAILGRYLMEEVYESNDEEQMDLAATLKQAEKMDMLSQVALFLDFQIKAALDVAIHKAGHADVTASLAELNTDGKGGTDTTNVVTAGATIVDNALTDAKMSSPAEVRAAMRAAISAAKNHGLTLSNVKDGKAVNQIGAEAHTLALFIDEKHIEGVNVLDTYTETGARAVLNGVVPNGQFLRVPVFALPSGLMAENTQVLVAAYDAVAQHRKMPAAYKNEGVGSDTFEGIEFRVGTKVLNGGKRIWASTTKDVRA